MGEWSPENTGGKWIGGASGPAVGARFIGSNTRGRRRWRTTCRVTAADPGREFAFEVTGGGVFPVATWRYEIRPVDGGCEVTESWGDRRGALMRWYGTVVLGVSDRVAHNRAGMEQTLDRLKAAAETW